jgi:hypothetical protein
LRSRILTLAVGAAATAVLLSGCTPNFTPQIPTVAASDVAIAVEDKLEETVGSRPDVDCGDDEVKLEVPATLTCLLTDPESGLEYDVVVTFTKVTGTDYEFDFKVADSPNNPPEPTVDPAAPSVSGDDIAALVITALTPELTAPPEVRCPQQTVNIIVGNQTYCQYDDETGSHDVEVTITEYDPDAGTYAINATVMS